MKKDSISDYKIGNVVIAEDTVNNRMCSGIIKEIKTESIVFQDGLDVPLKGDFCITSAKIDDGFLFSLGFSHNKEMKIYEYRIEGNNNVLFVKYNQEKENWQVGNSFEASYVHEFQNIFKEKFGIDLIFNKK